MQKSAPQPLTSAEITARQNATKLFSNFADSPLDEDGGDTETDSETSLVNRVARIFPPPSRQKHNAWHRNPYWQNCTEPRSLFDMQFNRLRCSLCGKRTGLVVRCAGMGCTISAHPSCCAQAQRKMQICTVSKSASDSKPVLVNLS